MGQLAVIDPGHLAPATYRIFVADDDLQIKNGAGWNLLIGDDKNAPRANIQGDVIEFKAVVLPLDAKLFREPLIFSYLPIHPYPRPSLGVLTPKVEQKSRQSGLHAVFSSAQGSLAVCIELYALSIL